MTGYLSVAIDVPHPVEFIPETVAGKTLLGALSLTAFELGLNLEITCGSNGHPPNDPHTKGEAFDVRSHKFNANQKSLVLTATMGHLKIRHADIVLDSSGGLVTTYFFGWLEHPGAADEHFHFQLRHGQVFAPDRPTTTNV